MNNMAHRDVEHMLGALFTRCDLERSGHLLCLTCFLVNSQAQQHLVVMVTLPGNRQRRCTLETVTARNFPQDVVFTLWFLCRGDNENMTTITKCKSHTDPLYLSDRQKVHLFPKPIPSSTVLRYLYIAI